MSSMKIVPESQWLCSKVQSLRNKITSCEKGYKAISRELNDTFSSIQKIKQKAESVFMQTNLERLEEEMRSLYKDYEDGLVNREVSKIHKESESLKCSLKSGKINKKAVSALKKHIRSFENSHRPSIEDLRVIGDAKLTVEAAEGKKIPHHINFLSAQKDVQCVDDVDDLYSIASLVHGGKMGEAKRRFRSDLSEQQKMRFEEIMRNLLAAPFDDRLQTEQALFALASESLGINEPYKTEKEIDAFFLGLKEETAQEETDKVISFSCTG